MATANITDLKQHQQPLQKTDLANMKPKDQIAYFLNAKKGEIEKMLPKHLNAERLLKVAQIAATTTPALLKCDVPSLVGAIGQCAQMGLEPNTVLGHAYLVPFNTKRKDADGNERWVNSVQVIIGYKGLIDLARRSGQIVSIAAHEVCANDKFELVYGLDEKLNHTPAMQDRGEVIGFYAVAKLKDGGHCCEFMSREQVEAIRDSSQGAWKDEWKSGRKTGNKVKANSPWWDHFIEMGRKTVIRRLAKYLPLSIEFQTAAALDGLADAGKDQRLDSTIDGDFTILPEDAPMAPGNDDDGVIVATQGEGSATTTATTESSAGASAQGSDPSEVTYAQVADAMSKAKNLDSLAEAADLIKHVADAGQQDELRGIYEQRKEHLDQAATKRQQRAGGMKVD